MNKRKRKKLEERRSPLLDDEHNELTQNKEPDMRKVDHALRQYIGKVDGIRYVTYKDEFYFNRQDLIREFGFDVACVQRLVNLNRIAYLVVATTHFFDATAFMTIIDDHKAMGRNINNKKMNDILEVSCSNSSVPNIPEYHVRWSDKVEPPNSTRAPDLSHIDIGDILASFAKGAAQLKVLGIKVKVEFTN